MADHPENRKVSLEEVLRLKRFERPEPMFWDRFDKDLREKQLAAIMVKRPWWQMDFGRMMAGVARARVPVGAAAVLALTFLAVREHRQPAQSGQERSTPEEVIASIANSQELDGVAGDGSGAAGSLALAAVAAESTNALAPSTDSTTPSSVHEVSPSYVARSEEPNARTTPSKAGSPNPWLGSSIDLTNARLVSGDARSFTPTLEELRDTTLETVPQLRGRGLQVATIMRDSAASEEPLAKLAGPANSQRARLASYVAAAFKSEGDRSENSDHRARERAISRLSNEELYSSVSRIGLAAGGGLRLTF